MTDLDALITEISRLHRERNDFLRIENATILRMRAVCRRLVQPRVYAAYGGKTAINAMTDKAKDKVLAAVRADADNLYDALETGDHPDFDIAAPHLAHHIAARDAFHKVRLEKEKPLRQLARQLPVWGWVAGVHGFGEMGLAQIVAEAGNLDNYANPAKLWKRFGLAPYRDRSAAAWRSGGGSGGGLTAEEWVALGYCPVRRSLMFVIGDSLLKKQNSYREVYLARKEVERAKLPDAAKIVSHRRAQRYMEKRLLRDLWRAWRNLPVDQVLDEAV